MNEKDTGHEHTGLGMELKLLLREPPHCSSVPPFRCVYYLSLCEDPPGSYGGRLDQGHYRQRIHTGIWAYPFFFLYCHGCCHCMWLSLCLWY